MYDDFCDWVEKLNLDPVKRVLPLVFFVFFSLAAVLYALGAYDFVFISRPEKVVSEIDNTDKAPEIDISNPLIPEPADTEQGNSEGDAPTPPEEPKKPFEWDKDKIFTYEMLSDVAAQGYYVTNTDYSADTHLLCVMNVDLGAQKEYTVRDRVVAVPVKQYEYENGDPKIAWVDEAQPRPAVEAYMGNIMVDNGNSVIMFDPYGRYIANYDESFRFAYTRDSVGAPLYYRTERYTVENEDKSLSTELERRVFYKLSPAGYMVLADYDDSVESRGLHMDYPATYGSYSGNISRVCIKNPVSFVDLKGKLTGWTRTLRGFTVDGQDKPFTQGWYDIDEKKPDISKMDEKEKEEYQKAQREEEEKRFYTAYNYSEGYACIADEKGLVSFIDQAGNKKFETKLDRYNEFSRRVVDRLMLPLTDGIESLGFHYFDHGLVRVRRQMYDYYQLKDFKLMMITYDDDELIYANGTKFPIPEGYDIISYSNGMILLEKDGKYGFMDYTGAWLIEPVLEGAAPFLEGLAAVKTEGKWGMIDTQANVVIPFDYDSIQNVSSGVVVCHSDRGWTVFTKVTK